MEKTPLAVQMAAGCAQLSRALLTAFQRLLLPREGTGAGGGMLMAMAVLGTLWCGVGEQEQALAQIPLGQCWRWGIPSGLSCAGGQGWLLG